ncbi:hypothetical protein E4U56_005459 [Claviceps arundinis]|uniref:Arb2 domain-containing protein n=1 Tax=Claviceps arundinis TaxID=1623583 RepID=A0A9P7MXZ1_9HYPO|nr:hypothetical protein E4U56_005459 [Claviceps arundinis]
MFRRLWTGLPKDVVFPADLKGLGYFVNEEDEIRSIENPDNYFKYFLNRNPRVNVRQRFQLDGAVRDIIHQRLQSEGLEKRQLPFGTEPHEPHVSIFASPNLSSKTRVVVIFGETSHYLGTVAGRVTHGVGGIDKGSMVSVVRELHNHVSSKEDPSPPGIVIANPAESHWWPEGQRCLTVEDSAAIPLPSLVHIARRWCPDRDRVSGNRSAEEHISYVFDELLRRELREDAKLSIVAVGQSCELLTTFLDDAENRNRWLGRLDGMILLGTVYPVETLNDDLKSFLAERSRAYILSSEPVNTPLAPPTGNPHAGIPALGSPCYSSAELLYTEKIFISALHPALQYLQEIATTSAYQNPEIIVAERPEPSDDDLRNDEETWDAIPEQEKPDVGVIDAASIQAQVKRARRFRRIVKGEQNPDTDDEEDDDDALA